MTEGRPTKLRHWLRDDSVRRIFRNAGVLLRGKIAAGVLSLGYMSLAAHTLGPGPFGLLILIHIYTMTVGSVALFPGWHSVIRYGSLCLEDDRQRDFHGVLSFAAVIEVASGLVGVAAAVVLLPVLAPHLGVPEGSIHAAMLYGFAILALIQGTPSGVLHLFERYDLLAWQQSLGAAFRLTGAIVAWGLGAGLPGFIVARMLGCVAEGAVQWAFGLYELRRRGLLANMAVSPRGASARHPGIRHFMLTTKLDTTLNDLSGRLTPLTAGWILDPAVFALFHVAQRTAMLLAQPALVLRRTVYPELSKLMARDDRKGMGRVVVRTGAVAAGACIPVVLLLAAFGRELLELIAGVGFGAGYSVLILIAVARVVHILGVPLNGALVAMGRPGAALRVNVAATLLLFPVLIGLLYWLGLIATGLHAIAYAVASVLGLAVSLGLRDGSSK